MLDRAAFALALRVAITVPVALFVSEQLIGGAQGPLFTAFGSFALLAMADFGGPPLRRLRAYIGGAVIGAALIALATPFSGQPLAAGLIALPVLFAIRFGGSFGAQFSAGVTAVTLSFVLAIAVEVPTSELDDRLLGWAIAGVFATAAALLMWPSWDREKLLRRLGGVANAFADGGLNERAGEAQRLLAEFRERRTTGVPVHATTLREERCFRRTVSQLTRLAAMAPLPPSDSPETDALRGRMESELRVCAAALEGDRSATPDVSAIERERLTHRAALQDRFRARLEAGDDPEAVLEELDGSFPVRIASLIVLGVCTNVLILTGKPVPGGRDLEIYPELEMTSDSGWSTGVRLARAWLRPGSARLRDAVRASIGLSAAVVVATATGVEHGFWVVLATLVVLRSNARGTGQTAFEVIGGTVAGFVIASILIFAIGTGETGLWVALPVVVFASAYLPAAVNLAAGQAAFAVFVVVLFNLFEPVGWSVGLVRVEDVVLGAAISLVVGMLLWPRGATSAIRAAAIASYRRAGDYLASVIGEAVPAGGPLAVPPREQAMAATVLVADAIDQHRGEPGPQLDREQEFALLDGPRLIRAAADGWLAMRSIYPGEHGPATALHERAGLLGSEVERLAVSVEKGVEQPPVERPPDLSRRVRAEAIEALGEWRHGSTGNLRIVWERDWIYIVEQALADLESPVAEAGKVLS